MDQLWVRLLVAAGLIGLNACFVLAEFAIVKVRASRIELLARRGQAGALAVQEILHHLDLYLSACQLGITMASLGLGWIGEPAVATLFEGALGGLPWTPGVTHAASFALAFGLITLLHIVVGELVPRSIALQKPDIWSLWASVPLKVFAKVFRAPILAMADLSIVILRLLGFPPAAEAPTGLSEEEIRVMLGEPEAERRGADLERLMLFENVFDFAGAKVTEAMAPRERVAYLSLARPWTENLAVIRDRRFSRYPLCEADLDSVSGYVYVKDIALAALAGGGSADLKAAKRDLLTVGPDEPLHRLLKTMRTKGVHLAAVREPKGPVQGILTLEDVLEEIIGEVYDEYDRPQAWSLMDVLVPSAVETGVEAPDQGALFRRIIERLKSAYPALDAEEAVRLVAEREAKFSSAIGHGLAVPHGRLPSIDRSLVAVARTAKPAPFAAPDKVPVRLVFLVLTPSSQPLVQLKILARIASIGSNENVRRRLVRVKSAEQLVETLRAADAVLAAP